MGSRSFELNSNWKSYSRSPGHAFEEPESDSITFENIYSYNFTLANPLLWWAVDGWLRKLQVLVRLIPLPNELRLNNLKVPGMEPAGNMKWYLWSGIMTFRLSGLENTNVGFWVEFAKGRNSPEEGWKQGGGGGRGIHPPTNVFLGSLFFHKSILSSHILPLTNRIMMRIIFSNLTEKKNVLAFNFFLSVNEQFQETFLWDKGGGWNYTGNQTKKKDKKNIISLK